MFSRNVTVKTIALIFLKPPDFQLLRGKRYKKALLREVLSAIFKI